MCDANWIRTDLTYTNNFIKYHLNKIVSYILIIGIKFAIKYFGNFLSFYISVQKMRSAQDLLKQNTCVSCFWSSQ